MNSTQTYPHWDWDKQLHKSPEPVVSQSDNTTGSNNPTNLKTADAKGFRAFKSVEEGINASADQLYRYFAGEGPAKGKPTKSVKDVIALWRPESDRRGSKDISQANYEKMVADTIGVKPTDKLNIKDKNVLAKLIQGITKVEGNEVSLDSIMKALSGKKSNPVTSNEVAGTTLLSKAEEQFPYLKGKNINVVVNPNSKIGGKLEFYNEEEEGAGDTPRPKEIPLGQIGIEVRDTNIRPIDVLGDYVSHYAVYNDPKLKPLYNQFIKTIPERQQRERYNYAVNNFGEDRPYKVWKEMAGDPGMFRGYVFDQFPKEEFDKIYSPDQIALLNKVKEYLGIK